MSHKVKTIGRPKGSKNKNSFNVQEIANQYALEPFEFAMAVINNDLETLGETDPIPLAIRTDCAKFACKYLYSAKQAVQVSTGEGGIEMIVRDYRDKPKENET